MLTTPVRRNTHHDSVAFCLHFTFAEDQRSSFVKRRENRSDTPAQQLRERRGREGREWEGGSEREREKEIKEILRRKRASERASKRER